MNFSGKLTAKIVIKDDYIRTDGTCALYVQMFLNKKKKKLPLNIAVNPKHFDKAKQRVKSSCNHAKDYNLIIEKTLADINRIEVNYRLSNVVLTLDRLIGEYESPSSKIDFIEFWRKEMDNQKMKLKPGTFNQQMSVLRKLKGYQSEVFFYEITEEFLDKMLYHFKSKHKNSENTLNSFKKTFKKYLHIANEKGIITPLTHDKIKLKRFRSIRTFCTIEEINKLYNYYKSEFITENHKNVLSRFMFSCFTGLRISDIQKLTMDNIVNDFLLFTSEKTTKIQRIQLNKSALKFIGKSEFFKGKYTDQHINRVLKEIMNICGIKKKITFHCARHTFATNFLISGGRVEVLQELLGHSSIEETMIYVHIVEQISNEQIHNMDDILFNK